MYSCPQNNVAFSEAGIESRVNCLVPVVPAPQLHDFLGAVVKELNQLPVRGQQVSLRTRICYDSRVACAKRANSIRRAIERLVGLREFTKKLQLAMSHCALCEIRV